MVQRSQDIGAFDVRPPLLAANQKKSPLRHAKRAKGIEERTDNKLAGIPAHRNETVCRDLSHAQRAHHCAHYVEWPRTRQCIFAHDVHFCGIGR
jgi:hypothetical protein